jgi:hypothetical protein
LRSLGIHKGFFDLLHLERRVLCPGLCVRSEETCQTSSFSVPTYAIRGNAFDRDDLLLLVEEPSRRWRVGQEEEQVDPPQASK